MKTELEDQDYENFRAYHGLQYDRIDKLESRREIFNSLVLSASLGIITFGFSKDSNFNLFTVFGVFPILILSNFAAIMFSKRTRILVKMHQKRAEIARDIYAPRFNNINRQVGKIDSSNDIFNRTNLYIYLHWLTIFVVFITFASILYRNINICDCTTY